MLTLESTPKARIHLEIYYHPCNVQERLYASYDICEAAPYFAREIIINVPLRNIVSEYNNVLENKNQDVAHQSKSFRL